MSRGMVSSAGSTTAYGLEASRVVGIGLALTSDSLSAWSGPDSCYLALSSDSLSGPDSISDVV